MTVIRLIFALSLVLLGQSLASARGQGASVAEVVICSGTLTRVITLDENGRPVTRTGFCPDMAPGLFGHAGPTPVILPDRSVFTLVIGAWQAMLPPSLNWPVDPARGPPVQKTS